MLRSGMRKRFLLASLALAVAGVGCGRVLTTTTLHPDGSANRLVTIKMPLKNPMGEIEKENTPEKLFVLPTAGSGVKVEKSTEEENAVVKFSRQIAAGVAGTEDIVLVDPKKKPLATSTVTIKRLDDGNLEYTETIRWKGEKAKTDEADFAKMRAQVKLGLPERHQKTAEIDAVTATIATSLVQMLFGPPEPSLTQLLSNPDFAERKMLGVLYKKIDESLRQTMPDLTTEEIKKVCASLVDSIKNSALLKDNSASKASSKAQEKNSSMNDMMSMVFEIEFPGHLISTNGIVEPFSGKVYWSLYPVAASFGDVTLRAVIKP